MAFFVNLGVILVPLGLFFVDFERILDGFLVHCFAEWCQGVRTDFRLKLHLGNDFRLEVHLPMRRPVPIAS